MKMPLGEVRRLPLTYPVLVIVGSHIRQHTDTNYVEIL